MGSDSFNSGCNVLGWYPYTYYSCSPTVRYSSNSFAIWRVFLGFATPHCKMTHEPTHIYTPARTCTQLVHHKHIHSHLPTCTHTLDNGQREEVQGLFLSNFHWFYTSSVQELVDKQKIKLCRGWHNETSITKWLKIYRRLYLGYLYQFTLTFIGFTTFWYLKNLSFSLQKNE